MQNHFELFHLPEQFELDQAQLEHAYREVQARVHPDKFVNAASAEQRLAMQWATQANEAYQTLKNPLKRARYLCELHGVNLQTESNTAMPADFLMQQMEWREELYESKQDPAALSQLENHIRDAYSNKIQLIAKQLIQSDYHQAAQLIRQLMFLEKFREDIAHAQEMSSDPT